MPCHGRTKAGKPCRWKGANCPHHSKEGSGILSPITNRIKAVIQGPRNGPTGRLKDAIGKDKNVPIKSIKLARKPIISGLEKLMNTISLGKFGKKKRELGYDEVYHNYLIIELENGKTFKLEKNHIVEQKELNKSDLAGEMYEIPLKGRKMDTYELINNASKDNDPSFWRYRAEKDNCQRFTRDLIVKNGLLPDADDKPIPANQDAKALIDTLPGGTNLSSAVTDTANYADRILHGDGVKKKKRLNVNPFQ